MSDKGRVEIKITGMEFKKADDAIKQMRGAISDGGLSDVLGNVSPIMAGAALAATEYGRAMVRLGADAEEAMMKVNTSFYDIGLDVGFGMTNPFRESDIWGFNESVKNLFILLEKQRAAIAPTAAMLLFLVAFCVAGWL
jgi:hypothetical protein